MCMSKKGGDESETCAYGDSTTPEKVRGLSHAVTEEDVILLAQSTLLASTPLPTSPPLFLALPVNN